MDLLVYLIQDALLLDEGLEGDVGLPDCGLTRFRSLLIGGRRTGLRALGFKLRGLRCL